jgi:hypothetical protein
MQLAARFNRQPQSKSASHAGLVATWPACQWKHSALPASGLSTFVAGSELAVVVLAAHSQNSQSASGRAEAARGCLIPACRYNADGHNTASVTSCIGDHRNALSATMMDLACCD